MQVYTMLILLCTSNITYILCYHCLNSFKYPVTQFLLYLVFFIPGSAIHTITGIVSGLYSADSIVLQGLCRQYCASIVQDSIAPWSQTVLYKCPVLHHTWYCSPHPLTLFNPGKPTNPAWNATRNSIGFAHCAIFASAHTLVCIRFVTL